MATPRVLAAANVFYGTIGSLPVKSGDLVYHDGTDWELADASATTTRATAMVVAGGGKGATGQFTTHCTLLDTDAPYTVNGKQFLSETAGAHTATAPTAAGSTRQLVGIAVTTEVLDVKIEPVVDTSLPVRSSGADYDLLLVTADVYTDNRKLTLTLGDAARTLTINGNPTLNDWFDQAVKTTSAPTFAGATFTGSPTINDGVIVKIGTGGDGALVERASTLAANTALTSVLIGTPVTPAIAADSIILSNITASGDVLMAGNRGGNSEAFLFYDSSAGDLQLLARGVAFITLTGGGDIAMAPPGGDVNVTGNIGIGVYKVLATDVYFKQETTTSFSIRKVSDNAYAGIEVASIWLQGTGISAVGGYLETYSGDNFLFKADDTGVGRVTVASLISAADPYFETTLTMRLKPIATAALPGTPVEGMFTYDDTANKLKFYNGTAWETVTSA